MEGFGSYSIQQLNHMMDYILSLFTVDVYTAYIYIFTVSMVAFYFDKMNFILIVLDSQHRAG